MKQWESQNNWNWQVCQDGGLLSLNMEYSLYSTTYCRYVKNWDGLKSIMLLLFIYLCYHSLAQLSISHFTILGAWCAPEYTTLSLHRNVMKISRWKYACKCHNVCALCKIVWLNSLVTHRQVGKWMHLWHCQLTTLVNCRYISCPWTVRVTRSQPKTFLPSNHHDYHQNIKQRNPSRNAGSPARERGG